VKPVITRTRWSVAATTCRTAKMAKKAHRHVMQIEGKTEAQPTRRTPSRSRRRCGCPRRVGNIYNRLAVSRAHVVARGRGRRARRQAHRAVQLTARAARAEYFAGRIVQGAGAFVETLKLAEPLADRRCYHDSGVRSDSPRRQRRRSSSARSPTTSIGAVAFLGVDTSAASTPRSALGRRSSSSAVTSAALRNTA